MLHHDYMLFCIILISTVPFTGCEKEKKVEKGCIVLKYSLKEGFFTEYDSNGNPKFFKYPGKRISLLGKVIKNKEAGVSLSICGDNSVVHFELLKGKTFPSCPKSKIVELWYDEHGLNFRNFKVGDIWKITLTDKGKLVDIQPDEDDEKNEGAAKKGVQQPSKTDEKGKQAPGEFRGRHT